MHRLQPGRFFKTTGGFKSASAPKGITSVEDFDVLARMNVYPLNCLSDSGKAEFRSRLSFREYNGEKVVNGVGYNAINELGYSKYVDLIKIVTGKNPVIDGKQPPYDPRCLPGTWVSRHRPNPDRGHCCEASSSDMCWVPPEGNPCGPIHVNNTNIKF